MSSAVDTDESLWQRARVPVREALRADVGVLLSDTEIDRITRLVVQGRGGIWQRIATEYRDMLGRTEKALGRKEAELAGRAGVHRGPQGATRRGEGSSAVVAVTLFSQSAGGPSRLLVAGGRQFDDAALMESSVLAVIDDYSLGLEVVVVHGNARGADRLAGNVAHRLGLAVEPHDADWDGPCRDTCKPGHRRPSPGGNGTICPAAGAYRNQLMVDLGADALLALPLGRSAGTWDTMRRAKAAHIPVRAIERGSAR